MFVELSWASFIEDHQPISRSELCAKIGNYLTNACKDQYVNQRYNAIWSRWILLTPKWLVIDTLDSKGLFVCMKKASETLLCARSACLVSHEKEVMWPRIIPSLISTPHLCETKRSLTHHNFVSFYPWLVWLLIHHCWLLCVLLIADYWCINCLSIDFGYFLSVFSSSRLLLLWKKQVK